MLDLIASLLIRGLNLIFRFTPIRFNLWLGGRCGAIVYLFSGRRKRVTYANLKASFCGLKTPWEIRRIAKGVYINMVRSFAEIVSMTKFNDAYIEKHISVRNMYRIEELSRTGRGVIFITGHFGNWEFNSLISAVKGYPLFFLGREQKMKRLYALMNKIRETRGNVVIRKGTDVKRIIRVLHQGKIVGMAGDQNAGANGELLYLFGRLASTAVGPFRIAERTGAHILPAFIHRVSGPYHELVLEEPMDIKKGENIIPYMEKFNGLLEKHVSSHPDQWLWMHKRWKMNPEKKVMVLDDGKKGHLKQSMAVLKEIKRFRESEGYKPEHVRHEVVPIIFKSRVRRFVLNAMLPLLPGSLQGRPFLLKWALDGTSYESCIGRHADIIVSSGSALRGVNRMLKLENYARNVTVLDPGRSGMNKFDLVVLPEHDAEKRLSEKYRKKNIKEGNVIITELAPNLICPAELSVLREEMMRIYPPKGNINIGVLIGGDNSRYVLTEDLCARLSEKLIEACEQADAYLFLTTSRRTGPACGDAVRDFLSPSARCRLLVCGKEDQDPRTVEKIMSVSDVLIVSGESISMVSESVASGKPVMVFMPEKLSKGETKYGDFVNKLEKKGMIRKVVPGDIPSEVVSISSGRKSEVPDDGARIREKLYRLF